MFIYIFTFLVLLLFHFVYDVRKVTKGYKFSYILAFLILVLVAGLRYKIGSDTLVYIDEYKYYPNLDQLTNYNFRDTRYDILWVFFCAICKTISNSYFFMQFVHVLIINSIFFYFIYKNTNCRFTSVLLYFLLGFLYFNTEILRESMAVSVFLLGLPSFYKRKWVNYYLYVLIAALFHSSALVTFIFPLFSRIKFSKAYILSIFVIALSASLIWQIFNKYIKLFFIISSIETKANVYLSNEIYTYNLNGILYGLISYVVIPFICVLYYYKRVKEPNKEAPLIWLYISFGIFIIYNNTIFTRFQNYLFFPFIIFLTYLFNAVMQTKKRKSIYSFQLFLIFLLLTITKYYNFSKLDITQTTYIYQRYIPYHSIITKKTTKEREVLDNYW